MGENPIALRSKNRLTEALRELLEEKPYSDITITELCSRARLSRPAFYQNFDRMDDIFDRLLRNQLDRAADEADIHPGMEQAALVSACLAIMDSQSALFEMACSNNMQGNLERQFSLAVRGMLLKSRVTGKSHDNAEGYAAAFRAAGIASALVTWFEGKRMVGKTELESVLRGLV